MHTIKGEIGLCKGYSLAQRTLDSIDEIGICEDAKFGINCWVHVYSHRQYTSSVVRRYTTRDTALTSMKLTLTMMEESQKH